MNLEPLESRELLATFTVTNPVDNGDNVNPTVGSLRAAVVALDADPTLGADSITFNILSGIQSAQTIALKAPLPAITHSVVIDGTTQPGFSTSNDVPVIVIDGGGAGAGSNGLVIAASGSSVIRALSIVGFVANSSAAGGEGIFLAGTVGGNQIQDDFIGVEPDGRTVKANANGVLILTPNNIVGGTTPLGGNVISGNANAGVAIAGASATGNVVLGNTIGSSADESAGAGNTYGVMVMAPRNTIGGTSSAAGNVISGNVGPTGQTGCGILIEGQAPGNLVQGNRIGVNAPGTAAILPTNIFPKITYSNVYGIYLGTQGDTANDNLSQETVGGSVAGAGNQISGNYIGITGNVTASMIQGNLIGLNQAGTAAIPNGDGVLLGAVQTTIGGTVPLARNVISGNSTVTGAAGTGLALSGDSNVVEENFIGVGSNGLAATGLGNVVGMLLGDANSSVDLTGSTIGGSVIGLGNVISGNSSNAIAITNYTGGGDGDAFYGNVIGLDLQGHPDANGGNGIILTVNAPATILAGMTMPLALDDSIGGVVAGLGNILADNGGAGVVVDDFYPTGISGLGIRGNTIFGNAKLGIDTQGTGVPTPSTFFLNGATVANGLVTLSGVYFDAPGTTVSIDLFANAADPSGFGQGPVYLGTTNATTGASGFALFTATFAAPVTSPLVFSATYTGASGNTSDFTANYPTAAGAARADLVVVSSASSSSLVVGNTITLAETVINYGSSTATNVALYDTLPATLVNATAVSSVGATAIGLNNVLFAAIGSLAPGAHATVTITATTSQAGTLVDQSAASSTVFDPNYATNFAAQSINVASGNVGPSSDLAILETATPTSALLNSPVTFTISIGNIGPSAATNATVTDFLPAGATLVGYSASQGAPPTLNGTVVTDNLGTIAPGGIATIIVVVTPTVAGPLTNAANVAGNQYDPVKTNNATTLTVPVVGPTPSIHFYLAQSAFPTVNAVGQFQAFTLTVENFGPSTATNVLLIDNLPGLAAYYSSTTSQGLTPVVANGQVIENFGTLVAGGIATLQIIVIPTAVGAITNGAGVYTPDVPSAAPAFATSTASIVAAPSVVAVNGTGGNAQIVLAFNEALNATTATNPANYQLVALGKSATGSGKTISIASILYNPTSRTVMILPSQALDPLQYYRITLIGATSSGIADTLGRRLASTLYGSPGSNFSATFLAGSLPQV